MSTGFNFGAKPTVAPAFGATSGSIMFGTPTAPQTSTQQQFGFGSMASGTAAPLFGAQPAAPALNLSMGGFGATTAAAPTTQAATPGLGFASTPQTGTSFGFNLAAPAATSMPSLSLAFGAPTTSMPASTTATTTALSFGAPPAGSNTLGTSFGAPTVAPATTGLTFGAATTALTTPSIGGFGLPTTSSSLFAVPTTTSSSGLNFTLGAPVASSSTSSTSGLTLGGFSAAATTSTAPLSQQQNVGLGGLPTAQTKSGSAATAQKEIPPKEQPLPNEFIQLVEQFKNVVQQHKSSSSDVSRCSIKEFRKVESELDLLTNSLNQIESQLQTNRNLTEKLKYDTAKGLQHIEIAQRTQDTPAGLQYENTAPLQFFIELAEHFEKEMHILKAKIDNTEKFIRKYGENSALSSQDLALGMRKLHETFVALAGRMQAVHNQVEQQKEMFLSIRKQAIKDNLNPFETISKPSDIMNQLLNNAMKLTTAPSFASGPTPFNNMAIDTSNVTMSSTTQPPPAYPGSIYSGGGSTGVGFGGVTSAFGTQTATNQSSLFKPTQSFQLNTSSPSTNFQLQKPPTGNKRGKQ